MNPGVIDFGCAQANAIRQRTAYECCLSMAVTFAHLDGRARIVTRDEDGVYVHPADASLRAEESLVFRHDPAPRERPDWATAP